MDIRDFAKRFPDRMDAVRDYLEGEGVKMDIGRIAIEHTEENFRLEGYVDEVLNPWREVKRRDPSSPWYGHSGQTGRRSSERTRAKILHGETRELSRATRVRLTPTGIRVVNATPYAAVHQYGLPARIYGKKPFTMPARPFLGPSRAMIRRMQDKVRERLRQLVIGNS